MVDQLEGRDPVVAASDRLAVEQEGIGRQIACRRRDQRIAVGEVVAAAGKDRTRSPARNTRTRKPSCLISCSQPAPAGGVAAPVGRQGAMKPGGWLGRGTMWMRVSKPASIASRAGCQHLGSNGLTGGNRPSHPVAQRVTDRLPVAFPAKEKALGGGDLGLWIQGIRRPYWPSASLYLAM